MRENACLYMRTLAATGSITRAAAQLYVTPSALSKYIATLEKEAGSPLFSRAGNHFVLTHAGKRYLDWAEKIESLEEQMKSEMLDISEQRRGKIRFGVQTSLGDFMLHSILPDYVRDYPGIDLAMTEDNSVSLFNRLRHYEIDAAISTHKPEDSRYHCESLIAMEQVFFVPSSSPLVEKAVKREDCLFPWVSLEDCKEERLILMHRGQAPRANMEEFFGPVLGEMRVALEVRQLRSMFEAVNNGLGILVGGDGMERLFLANWQNLVKLCCRDDMPPTVFYLIYQEDVHRSLAMEAFFQLIRERFRILEEQIRGGNLRGLG